ncbi:YhgE/Pip domain-containing protein [Paenibacillus sp. FJAT-26967]|uniref:YhgE/Pip domain-containing protein n=1 Tax=Paenibacillus sp. FJAT-26967 TaxID=1729690 RepID=UPI000837B815|nr:ABC transporter permease [Paenibacillus sp. FJAT-26967]
MKSFVTLLKDKSVIGGIVMALFYQIVFISVFMYGYSAVPKNIDQLSVSIVNEDTKAGKDIAEQLQKQLPFQITSDSSLAEAKEELNNRKTHMIVHIPSDFTEQLSKQGEQVKMDFLINQSNPAMVTSTMQQVVSQITGSLNQQFAVQGVQGILQGMNVPDEQAKQLSEQVPAKLAANVINSNEVPAGMHNQMAPFFLSMVSYVGAMIFSMLVVGATLARRKELGTWQAFWSAQGINALVSLVAPVVGLTIYFLVQGGFGGEIFMKAWMLQALEMFAAIEFMSIFCLLLGDKAIFVNITLLLMQTISSGAVMTQDMMPGLFKALSYVSVMFYSVQTSFSILFGGGQAGVHLLGLALMAVISLLVGTGVYTLKNSKALRKPAVVTDTAS